MQSSLVTDGIINDRLKEPQNIHVSLSRLVNLTWILIPLGDKMLQVNNDVLTAKLHIIAKENVSEANLFIYLVS